MPESSEPRRPTQANPGNSLLQQARLQERELEFAERVQALEQLCAPGSGTYGHLNKEQVSQVKTAVAEIHVQGYTILRHLLDAATLERLRDGLAPFFEATGRLWDAIGSKMEASERFALGGKQTIHVQNVLAKSRAADEVAMHPVLRMVVAGTLGKDFIFNAGAVAMSPDPGCSPQVLHRDDGFYPLPRPHMPLVLTVAVALDEFSQENGSTCLVLGSHLWDTERSPEEGMQVHAEMSAGSVLMWDGSLLHGGGGNSSQNRSRRTLTLNYTRGWLRTQFNQYLSVPRPVVLSLAPELQADLGYQPSIRNLGRCDNQMPLKYLRKLTDAGGDGAQPFLGQESKL